MFKRLVVLVVAFVAIAAMSQTTSAQTVPYKASGSNAEFSAITGDYGGSGKATHLGKHVFFGGQIAVTQTGALTFDWEFTLPQETIAADGSKLYFDGVGTVELIPLDNLGNFTAEWTGEFHVLGGTRRFANAGPAAAPLQVIAVNDPFNFFTDPVWTFSWELTGEIDLGRRKR